LNGERSYEDNEDNIQKVNYNLVEDYLFEKQEVKESLLEKD
jgi:hypothetical protein